MAHPQSRMTRQRRMILEELRNTRSHPTADEIYARVRARLPRISLGTVYRNLDVLAAGGDIVRLDSGGGTRRFDGNVIPHQHVRCRCCGRVADVCDPVRTPDPSEVHVEGFTITTARVEFEGVCDLCRTMPA